MITRFEFEQAAETLRQNLFLGLPKMIEYKKSIQVRVLDVATSDEMFDVAACRINQQMIDKLARLAHEMWIGDGNAVSLYCASMAVATIIKEYNWGRYYLTPDGLFEIATRIQDIK